MRSEFPIITYDSSKEGRAIRLCQLHSDSKFRARFVKNQVFEACDKVGH